MRMKFDVRTQNYFYFSFYFILFIIDGYTTFLSTPEHEKNPIIRNLWLIGSNHAYNYRLILAIVILFGSLFVNKYKPNANRKVMLIFIPIYAIVILHNFYVLFHS